MSMRQIDATGKACPIPVIEAKKALSEAVTSGVMIIVDNIIAVQNLEKMAGGFGYGFSYKEEAGTFKAIIQKDAGTEVPLYDPPPPGRKLVVVLTSDALGDGSGELGRILMKAFIYSLTELDAVPSAVIFMNRGAYLTAEGSNATDDLKILEGKGTEVLTCGTCSDYYGFSGSPAVGSTIDMFGITERMALADAIINF